MLLLIHLVLGLLAMGATVEVEPVAGPVRFTDLYGSPREAVAATACRDGASTIWLARDGIAFEIVLHELAHAYDCADNGEIDGSPAGRPAERPAWSSDYCWNSPAEWYACSLTETGRLRPYQQPIDTFPATVARRWLPPAKKLA